MTKITGKQGIITFEVIQDDQEKEKLLEDAITSALTAIVNQDIPHLKQMVSVVPSPKQKVGASPQEKFKKENVEAPVLIPLGGKWAYAVSIVQDESGKAVRIAKGTIKGSYYRDKKTNQMILTPNDPNDPIAMASRINIKRLSDWSSLQGPVMARLKVIEETQK